MLNITVGQKSFSLSDEEERILLVDMVDIAEWIENLVRNKIRQVIDRLIEQHTPYNPRRLSREEKLKIIASLDLKTAAERQAELEAEMTEKT